MFVMILILITKGSQHSSTDLWKFFVPILYIAISKHIIFSLFFVKVKTKKCFNVSNMKKKFNQKTNDNRLSGFFLLFGFFFTDIPKFE